MSECMKVLDSILIAIPSTVGREVYSVPFANSLAEICLESRHLPCHIEVRYFAGLRIDAVRLQILQYAREKEFTLIFFMDDDMLFPRETLTVLYQHYLNGCRVVSGLYGAKSMPYHWFLMPVETEGHVWNTTYEPGQLVEVKSIATGCLLVEVSVFDEIFSPPFLLKMDIYGRIVETEDCFFAKCCQYANIPMWVDTDILCQHIKTVAFPAFWDDPGHYHEGQPPKQPTGVHNVPYPFKMLKIHPRNGLSAYDGVVDCRHDRQVAVEVNKGEEQLFKCLDCGLISKGVYEPGLHPTIAQMIDQAKKWREQR